MKKKKQPKTMEKKLTRKQLRKQERKDKKRRKHEYYTNRKKPGRFVLNPNKTEAETNVTNDQLAATDSSVDKSSKPSMGAKKKNIKPSLIEAERNKELREMAKLKNQMNKQRIKQLIEENQKEDQNIRHLEKQLNLHKRKSKSIPKSFTEDGLDYLLEVCDPETKAGIAVAEGQLHNINEFEEDLELMGSKTKAKDGVDSEASLSEGGEDFTDEELDDNKELDQSDIGSVNFNSDEQLSDQSDVDNEKNSNSKGRISTKRKSIDDIDTSKSKKQKLKQHIADMDESENDDFSGSDGKEGNEEDDDSKKEDLEQNDKEEGIWEDIYGRKRRKDGSLVDEPKQGKYIPPALRANSDNIDKQRSEKLAKLRKHLKGLLNRLAERNMHSIASEVENLYMNNSRNDMNNTITDLILESIISHINTPERLLMEHVLLMVILHANVGTEVGAHFLQVIVKKFDTCMKENHPIENKTLDNVVNILSYLYDFKLFGSKLLYEVIEVLSQKFREKEVECILHILRNVGFSLRKDDPLVLKDLLINLHKKARDVPEEMQDDSRVKFMLEILLAIKNNNMRKIPNYDPSYSEHLKKVMKGFIRKGNYVTQLNISLEDLLSADEKGKWWVVGSAWTGNLKEQKDTKQTNQSESFSEKILKQAKKHRMNTDTRRNIFCIVMSAEDYLDAFQKLLHLGLKNQQEREIIDIILYCLLHEKTYNLYYTVLIRKFCEYDRKYQVMLKYAIWDKLKVIGDLSGYRLSSLAKLLIHLFINKALSISTLKIIEFGELDKVTMRFVRQIFLGILLHENEEEIKSVFENVAKSDKLKMFREKINLFIHHFLLKNLDTDVISTDQKLLLETRAKFVEKLLMFKNNKFIF